MASLEDFLKDKTYSGEFEPRPFYSREGDCLTLYIKDTQAYGKRIDNFLTVYKSIETEELVGCQIKSVKAILERLGQFGVVIRGRKVELGLLFLAYAASADLEDEDLDQLGRLASAAKATINSRDLQPAYGRTATTRKPIGS